MSGLISKYWNYDVQVLLYNNGYNFFSERLVNKDDFISK